MSASEGGPVAKSDHSEGPVRDHSDRRLVGFTDGVVAIAITVIILPLVDSARSFGSGPTFDFLSKNVFNLEAAGLSFVVIANFWMEHHRLYKRVTSSTPSLVYANLVWLAAIVFLPLPTVLIVDSPGHDPVAAGLYIGTILVADVAIRLQELVIVRNRLTEDPRPSARSLWAAWSGTFLTFLALVISLTVPATGLYPLLILLLTTPLSRLIRSRAPRGSGRRSRH
jgi:uncharacterized membrane protein